MADKKIRVGDRVTFNYTDRTVYGVVREDRGPIGVKGRRLYLIEFHPDSLGEYLSQIEMPGEEITVISASKSLK